MYNDRARLLAGVAFLVCTALFIVIGGTTPLQEAADSILNSSQSAATFFVKSITAAQIRNDYHKSGKTRSKNSFDGKVNILIVPGHQPDTGGTEFNGIYERDVVVDMADALANLLAQNPRYEVTVARSKTAWNPVLQSYFDTHANDIDAFIESQKSQMNQHLANGSIIAGTDQVSHNSASPQAARILYGINKWSSENHVDIALHLHLNDYAGRRPHRVGKYDGFAVYVPDKQYSNAEASLAIGTAISVRLNTYHATSTIPKENVGVIEDQELIAIGSNNTADSAALLIEYGYIYEPQFQNPEVRPAAVTEYAYATYLGLQDFFKDSPSSTTSDSLVLPYDWNTVTNTKDSSGPGVYALQTALRRLGHYPPKGKSFSDCPISGKAGPCTQMALSAYQKAKGLEATGTLGPKTRAALEQDLASH